MGLRNYRLPFRPLQGGIAIGGGATGAIGLVATADGKDRWILSCYDVLGGPGARIPGEGAPVLQPPDRREGKPVAHLATARVDPSLDCAAVRIEPGVGAVSGILGLPPLGRPMRPGPGMRVVKSGPGTGVTEGVITAIRGDEVIIEPPPGFPEDYELIGRADAGAVWVEVTLGAPVALQTSCGTDARPARARAVALPQVLRRLGLRPV
jgi:hypothetical protein